MFWIYDKHSPDNTAMFYLLLITSYTASRPFLLLTAPPVNKMGMHKRLGGDTAGTADPNRSKGYSIPYDVTLSNKI